MGWQVEDYRQLSTKCLFSNLRGLGIYLDKPTFLCYVDSCEDPEDLLMLLTESMEASVCDRVYLHIFELWRRLAYDRPTMTLFCDELDCKIGQYEIGQLDATALEDTVYKLLQFFVINHRKGEKKLFY